MIKEMLAELAEQTTGPVSRVLERGENFKIIVLAFSPGMILKAHKTPVPAKLIVVHGQVNYRQGDQVTLLEKFDEMPIPVDLLHSVEAIEESVCFLIQAAKL